MRARQTARGLLLAPEGRTRRTRARLPFDPDAPSVWFTVGGGMEPGESVPEAAAREIVEETGLTDARLVPVRARSEALLYDRKRWPVHFKESFVVAYTAGGPLSREGWQPLELEFVD